MDHAKFQNHSFDLQRSEQEDAEIERLRLIKSLTFEQKLAWLEWAQRQVATRYGWKIAQQNNILIDQPRFEPAHLQLIHQTSNPADTSDTPRKDV